MNKILVSSIIDLKDDSYIIKTKDNKININIFGKVYVYLIDELINELNIELNNNSTLYLYKYNKNNNIVININQYNNSNIYYNESFINDIDSSITINNYIKGNNNNSNIKIRNISNNDNSKILINVVVEKDTLNNTAIEDLKGINNGGFIHIEPNILCSSNEVSANHLTTIGNLNEQSINYLMSKGIKEEDARDILLKGFIFSNMDDYIKNVIGGDINE